MQVKEQSMAMNSPDGPLYRYRFGSAEFDEARMELQVSGLAVELEHKPLRVLAELLRHSDEVVTRQQMKDSVWDGRETVDQVLSNTIVKLRKALADEQGERIVTVPRVGYKLVGPVSRIAVGRRIASRLAMQAGEAVPGRSHFLLETQLESSRNSEVWLARHEKTREPRVFKFSPDSQRLAELKREATLFRLLSNSLGERDDFARILDWNFETAPFYLECEYGGENLADWAVTDQRLEAMSIEQRLELFLQIADALAAAHSVGVLHKDLKPANILVAPKKGSGWQIRVADFGSGRLLEPGRLADLGITPFGLTATLNILNDPGTGTLLYLAPELISGSEPTVQSDVYALGLMLYQILIADLRRPLAPGWEQDIADDLLREDIAAATDGQPARRLANVAQLVERLRTRPARAQVRQRAIDAEARAERAERMLERSRTRRPWLIGLIASLTLGLAISLWLYRRETAARLTAEQAETRADAINRFLNDDVLGAADPSGPGGTREPTIKDALVRAAGRLENRFSDDPKTKASIETALGKAYFGVSDYANADIHLRRAVSLFQQAGAGNETVALDARYSLVVVMLAVGKFSEAEAMLDAVDVDAGSRLLERSLTALRSRWIRANLYKYQAKIDKALTAFEAAEAIRPFVSPDDDQMLFRIKDGISWCYLRLQRNDDAERVLRDLLTPRYTPDTVGTLFWAQVRFDYGMALKNLGRYDEAENIMLLALKQEQAVLGPDHYFVALGWNQLSELYSSEGKLGLTLEATKKSYEIFRARVGEHSLQVLSQLANLGILQYRSGHPADAIESLSQVRDEFIASRGADDALVQIVSFYLASAETEGKIGDPNSAAAMASKLQSTALTIEEPGNNWDQRIQALNGEILIRQGRKSEGVALLKPAVAKMEQDRVEPTILAPYQKALASAAQ